MSTGVDSILSYNFFLVDTVSEMSTRVDSEKIDADNSG